MKPTLCGRVKLSLLLIKDTATAMDAHLIPISPQLYSEDKVRLEPVTLVQP